MSAHRRRLSKNHHAEILLESSGRSFFIDIEYENLSDFCDRCQAISHSMYTVAEIIHRVSSLTTT